MATRTRSKARKAAPTHTVVTSVQRLVGEHRRGLACAGVILVTVWVLAALYTWHPDDPTSIRPHLGGGEVHNAAGSAGAEVAELLLRAFGHGAWAIAVPGIVAPLYLAAGRRFLSPVQWLVGGWLFTMLLAVTHLAVGEHDVPGAWRAGGWLGAFVATALVEVIGIVGAWIALAATVITALSVMAGVSWSDVARAVVTRVEAEKPVVRARAVAAGATVGAWTKAGLAACLRLLVGLASWVGHQVLRALSAAWRAVATAGGRARLALTRDDATLVLDDDAWREVTGLERPESSGVPELPADALAGTAVDDPTTPTAEVVWSGPADGAVDELLGLFPDLNPRHTDAEADPTPVVEAATEVRPTSWAGEGPTADEASAADAPSRAGEAPGRRAGPAIVLPEIAGASDPSEPDEAPAPPRAVAPPRPAAPPRARPVDAALDDDEDPLDDLPPAPRRPRPQPARPADAYDEDEDAPTRDLHVEAAEGLQGAHRRDDGRSVSKRASPTFELPALSLLDEVPEQRPKIDKAELAELARTVEESLASFKVTGRVTNVRVGPVVTIFEFEPDPGIKVRRVANLADDLALSLRARSVRVVAPIPGKGVVGIEIPSRHRLTIYLREMLASDEFRNSDALLPVVLGKDVEGRPIVDDLAKMPHVLVGGTTGSGKSVGVNGMLLSLLYTRTPEELRLLLIDPKKLEFGAYDGVPHLLHPVVIEPEKAAAALSWACREMDRRNDLLRVWSARNLENFNNKLARELKGWNADKAWKYAPDGWDQDLPPPPPDPLPFLVVVIDELADLMMTAKKDVQDSIVRLAQMGRACGIHLIVATQRPSVDVVTGLIKANMPARISFKLRSVVDSRTIIDQGGAEKLLGRGDMLMLPGSGDAKRVHGAFVSDDEVVRVIEFLCAQREPEYIHGVTADPSSSGPDGDVAYDDPEAQDDLYDEAVQFVLEKGKASTSMVQRRFKIGYNRAARIIDAMEAAGLVGPADGARPREVLAGHGY